MALQDGHSLLGEDLVSLKFSCFGLFAIRYVALFLSFRYDVMTLAHVVLKLQNRL